MAQKLYVGESGLARNVSKLYVGVGGIAKKVTKGYVGVNGVARLFYSAIDSTDPNTRYDNTKTFIWNNSSDVDSFFNTYNHDNNYTGLSLGNLITINDGTYNAIWEIAGFDMEYNHTASDGLTKSNGYGICLIPKASIGTHQWNSKSSYSTTNSYINSSMHSWLNSTVYNILSLICSSHIINRNVLLGSYQTSSKQYVSGEYRYYLTSQYTWTKAYLTLMSLGQMTNTFASHWNKYDDGEANYYLPLFKYEDYSTDVDFWVRNSYGEYNYNSTMCSWAVWNASYGGIGKAQLNNSSMSARPLMYLR